MSPPRQRIAALLAAFAIGGNALWPMAPQAKPAHAGLPFEICTARGVVRPTGGAETPSVPLVAHCLTHCAICSSMVADVGFAPGAVQFVSPSEAARAVPCCDAPPPATSPTLHPRPRSPPVLP